MTVLDSKSAMHGVPRPWGNLILAGALYVACIVLGGQVHASPPDPKLEKADRLFAEGKALIVTNVVQACERFNESLRYNPAAIATLMNVALCDEKLGRVASAVAKFAEARERAIEQGLPEHVRGADEHIAALQPSVPHVAIKLTDDTVDAKVMIDNQVVAREMITNVPVDPGERVIIVTAPKRVPYRAKITIEKAEHRDLVIVLLSSPTVVVHSSRRRIGQITTAAGGTVILGAIGVGLYARHLYRSQFGHQAPGDGLCNEMNICEAEGKAATDRAVTFGNVGTALGIAGIGLAGVGAYLWYRSPGTTSVADHQLALVPHVTPQSASLVAMGRF